MHRLHREGKASQATFAGRLEGYKTCHSLANQITPRVSPVPLIQSFQHFYVISRRIFFFQRNESEAFQKKFVWLKIWGVIWFPKRKEKYAKLRNYCGLANDTSEKKIATCLCSIAHLPAHTTKCITFATQRFICGRSELKPFHRQCSTSAHVPSEKCKFTLKSIINWAFAGDLQHRYQATGRKTKNYIRKTERYFFIFTHA